MRFGICTSIDNMATAEKLGFDYIEPTVASLASMSEESFEAAVGLVDRSKIKCEAFNVLFPSYIKLVGKEYDEGVMVGYLKSAFQRIVRLGARIVVFGSGGARRVPEGIDMAEGRSRLIKVFHIVGDIASGFGLTIVVEPLNKGETNIINSVREGLDYVEEVDHPNVHLLADFYHMRLENEPMDSIRKAGPVLKHLHIANSKGRIYPRSVDEDEYRAFFRALKDIGYDGRISIEGSTQDLAVDGLVALSLLKTLTGM